MLVLTSGCLLFALLTCHQVRTTHFLTWYSLPFFFVSLTPLSYFNLFLTFCVLLSFKIWPLSLYFSAHHTFSFSIPLPCFKLFLFYITNLCFHSHQSFYETSFLFLFLFPYTFFHCINYINAIFPAKLKSFFQYTPLHPRIVHVFFHNSNLFFCSLFTSSQSVIIFIQNTNVLSVISHTTFYFL